MSLSKLLALTVYSMYVIFIASNSNGIVETLKLASVIFLPVLLILLPEQFGNYLGPASRSNITTTTPAFLVSFGGWLILVGVPLIMLLLGATP